jgi:hypothetical protein
MAKVTLGTFQPMDDDDIDEFTQVSIEDIELLKSTWQKYATPRFADLIDAVQDETVIDVTTTQN